MGAGNNSYVNFETKAKVTATRITKANFKSARGVPGASFTGDDKNDTYRVGDKPANPGDWAVNDGSGHYTVMSHGEFAATHYPKV
jgi:hypothetical protein